MLQISGKWTAPPWGQELDEEGREVGQEVEVPIWLTNMLEDDARKVKYEEAKDAVKDYYG